MGHGFWGPATATIDWCEANYEWSHFIAEFWNTVSSLLIAWAGWLNAWQYYRRDVAGRGASPAPSGELRHVVLSAAIVTVGVGSALFHGTLLFPMQMLDELPMVYAMCVWWFCWFELYGPTVQRPWLFWALTALAAAVTALHASGGYVEEFQIAFALMVLVGWVQVIRFSRSPAATRSAVRLAAFYISTVLLALVAWIVDRELCHRMPTPNPQLHAWWHGLIAVATYSSVHLVAYARGLALGLPVRLEVGAHGAAPPWIRVGGPGKVKAGD